MTQIYTYKFKSLNLKQKILFFLTLAAIIALSFLLFGLVVTVAFYLIIAILTIFGVSYAFTKIANFFKTKSEAETEEPNGKSPQDVIINAEVISVEIRDKDK